MILVLSSIEKNIFEQGWPSDTTIAREMYILVNDCCQKLEHLEKIWQVQGIDPSVEVTQDIVEESSTSTTKIVFVFRPTDYVVSHNKEKGNNIAY